MFHFLLACDGGEGKDRFFHGMIGCEGDIAAPGWGRAIGRAAGLGQGISQWTCVPRLFSVCPVAKASSCSACFDKLSMGIIPVRCLFLSLLKDPMLSLSKHAGMIRRVI
jgi:hypothetical protein